MSRRDEWADGPPRRLGHTVGANGDGRGGRVSGNRHVAGQDLRVAPPPDRRVAPTHDPRAPMPDRYGPAPHRPGTPGQDHGPGQGHRVTPGEPGPRMARRAAGGRPPSPPDDDPPDVPRGGGKGGGGGGKMRLLAWGSIVMTGVLVATTLTGYTLYRAALGNIKTEDVNARLGDDRPVNATGALNVLLVGSDTREGDNLQYGQKMENAGKRTDTLILLHISPNRDNAMMVSFPRDSIVQIPACEAENGAQLPAQVEMINAAYNLGGISCTIKTIESLTKIRIDHFVEIDFTGFKSIVDALGGIRVCLRQPVDDKKSKLTLAAGWHSLNGEKALGYVRLRNYGDGSDTQRIKRQQVFLAQVVKKATSSDLLTDPGKLLGFVQAAAGSVKMDPDLAGSTETLLEIGLSAKKLTANGVKFITVPGGPHPDDKNRVQWRQPEADKLFTAIRSDIEVTPTATPKPSAKPAIKPAQIRVQVLNASGVAGKAKEAADALAAQGFVVTHVGNATVSGVAQPTTKVLYSKRAAEGADYAAPVAAKLIGKVTPEGGKIQPGSLEQYQPDSTAATTGTEPGTGSETATETAADAGATAGGPAIQLVIGTDWEGIKAPVKIPDSVKDQVVDAKTDPCQ